MKENNEAYQIITDR